MKSGVRARFWQAIFIINEISAALELKVNLNK